MERTEDVNKDLEKFAQFTIERWVNKMYKLKIRETGQLIRSFENHVYVDANGNPQLIVFTYLYYGIFPDLGVGGHVTMDKTPSGNRHPKPWYNKVFWSRLRYLADYTAEHYGMDAARMVKSIIGRDNTNNMNN
ncbi:MAG: hypothetical protein II817_05525 [Bacteroidales bacterium]|nr:hypothetical protein [Bacteroidales bacterium]MBQ6083298.1 hypothetical protein [Bacteroidales bacterium]